MLSMKIQAHVAKLIMEELADHPISRVEIDGPHATLDGTFSADEVEAIAFTLRTNERKLLEQGRGEIF